jgi:actinin alpha
MLRKLSSSLRGRGSSKSGADEGPSDVEKIEDIARRQSQMNQLGGYAAPAANKLARKSKDGQKAAASAWNTKIPKQEEPAAAEADVSHAPKAAARIGGRRRSGLADGGWIVVQQRAFTKWGNVYLRKVDAAIENVMVDFADGIILMKLMSTLCKDDDPKTYKVNNNPKMRIHKLENLKKSFDLMRSEGMKMVNVGAEDIADGNDKIILAMMWGLIMHFSVGSIELDGISGKDGLLLWCQRQTKAYDNVDIKNFSKSWKNGLAFCALLHRFGPEHIPYDELTADDPQRNLELAFKVAEEVWGIERIIDPEDILDAVRPDEKIIITYLAEWFKCFAKFMKDEAYVNCVLKAIETTKKHDELIVQYDAEGIKIQEWITDTESKFSNVKEGAEGFGNTTAAIKTTLDAFYDYQFNIKPENKAAITNLEGLLTMLHASEKNNDRPMHEVPAELHSTKLAENFATLEARETAYEAAARESYAHFQRIDNILQRFEAKYAKLKRWMGEQQAIFNGSDLGSSSLACEALLDNFGLFETQQTLYYDKDALAGVANAEGIDLHAGHPGVVSKISELEQLMGETNSAGQAYKQKIAQNKEEWERLAALLEPSAWMDAQKATFEKADVGSNTMLNKQCMHAFSNEFTAKLPAVEATLSKVEANANPDFEDVGVKAKVEELKGTLEELKEAAAAHEAKLKERQGTLADLKGNIKNFNSLACQFEFACDTLEEDLVTPVAESVEEARAVVDAFDNDVKPKMTAINMQFGQIEVAAGQLQAAMETEEDAKSAFARYTLDCLQSKQGKTAQELEEYGEHLADFMAGEQEKEGLRQEFAHGADAFKGYCDGKGGEVKALGGDLKAQSDSLKAMLEEVSNGVGKEQLEKLEPIAKKLEELGSINNAHTPETIHSLRAMHGALVGVLEKALQNVDEQILAEQTQGLTPEQVKEIAEVFNHFDKDSSGSLTTKEFHACTSGIGLVLTGEEVEMYIKELDTDGNGTISFMEFSTFMVKQLSAGGTSKVDVIKSFEGLVLSAMGPAPDGDEERKAGLAIKKSTLERNFVQPTDREYLLEHMDQLATPEQTEEEEYEYTPFVGKIFTR